MRRVEEGRKRKEEQRGRRREEVEDGKIKEM